jgi:hypothetical protein
MRRINVKNQIAKMKLELKELARQIKVKKSQRKNKEFNNGCDYVPGLMELRNTYRHKHVAYCLARGRTVEQLDSGKGLNMAWVNWIVGSMNPESRDKYKLYVVVSDKLSPAQQAVQGGHALAEFLKKNPNTQWSNGHLIYLKESPVHDGNMRAYYSLRCGMSEYAEFVEPDVGNKVTAYAVFGPDAEVHLKNHKLV